MDLIAGELFEDDKRERPSTLLQCRDLSMILNQHFRYWRCTSWRWLAACNGSTGGDFRPQRPALVQRCQGNYEGRGGGCQIAHSLQQSGSNRRPSTVRRFLLNERKVDSYFYKTRESVIMVECTQVLDPRRRNEPDAYPPPRLPVSTLLGSVLLRV